MSVIKGHGSGEVSTGFYPYNIGQSLKFNDADSPYLKRTPSSQGSLTTFTYSFWYKRCVFGTYQEVLHQYPGSGERSQILFMTNDTLKVELEAANGNNFLTNMVFRDSSAWYHVVVTFDSTNGTEANRVKIYVNGVDQSDTANGGGGYSQAPYPSQNATSGFNTTTQHEISTYDGSDYHLDGYLAEVNFIDGTALTAASFGETKDGIWVPKDASGLTFGTNGFYLPFDDSSAIGDDESSNTNDWTVVNLVASDVVLDSPTNNFCTVNPLDNISTTYSEGNLQYAQSDYNYNSRGTFGLTSGKWYWEIRMSSTHGEFGVCEQGKAGQSDPQANIGFNFIYNNGSAGISWKNATAGAQATTGISMTNWSAGDICQIAYDADNGILYHGLNGTYQTSGDPAAGSGGLITGIAPQFGGTMVPFFGSGTGNARTFVVNFGQDSSFAGNETAQGNADGEGVGDFYYAPPSGFLALCSQNLPEPEIIDGTENFNTVLYTGNASTNAITGVGFSPDWVWVKNRASAYDHRVYDSVRGVEKTLYPSGTYYENEGGDGATGLTAFGTDGFTLGNHVGANKSGDAHVAWNWLAGTAFSNDASATSVGNVDSSGQVNTTAGFSIVSWQYTTSADNLIAHGLSSAPEMMIVKSRTTGYNWDIYHTGLSDPTSKRLIFTTGGEIAGFFDTNPTSTVFEYNTSAANNNDNMIAYCFHSVEGYSKVGSYIGNGNADGPFVHTGFRPAWIIVKKSSGTEAWWVVDSVRETTNPLEYGLQPNDSAAELSPSKPLDFLSNGFKPRVSTGYHNDSGANYIFIAFAEQPFKFANAR